MPRSSAADPAALGTVFTDLNLGAKVVPGLLRAAGLDVVTIGEHFGADRAGTLSDTEWLGEIAALDWVIFTQDARIRHNPAEAAMVRATGARMFCVPNGQLAARVAAQRYLDNLPAIMEAANERGPFIYGVYPDRIERLQLRRG